MKEFWSRVKFIITEQFLERYPNIADIFPQEYKTVEFIKQENGLIEVKAS